VSKKRIKLHRKRPEIVESATRLLGTADTEPPASPEALREKVRALVNLSRDGKELGLYHVMPLLPHDSAAERILAYLKLFVGQKIEGEELEVVSAISEYARRVREWRVEFGWPIEHSGSGYILESDEPNAEKAELWRTLNTIKRSGDSARDNMLALFRALPIGQPVTTAQLRYVANYKDMRRVRELRPQFGWRIMTRNTGMPQLKNNQYVLVDPEPMEPHDREIEKETVIAVLKRDGNRCQKCGWHPNERVAGDPRQYIELHHMTWHSEGGANDEDNLATLCNIHHRKVHTLKLDANAFKGWVKKPD
jgi:HNH endonuclease